MKKVLLLGATGLVGEITLNMLLENPIIEQVIVFSRREITLTPSLKSEQNIKLRMYVDDVSKLLQNTKIKVDVCISCLGTTITKAGSQEKFRTVDYDLVLQLAHWAERNQCPKMAVVSALGADPNSKIFYNRVKGEVERDLKKTSLQLLILQPSLLSGERQEFRLWEQLALKLAPLYLWMLQGSLKKYRPTPAVSVAECLVDWVTAGDSTSSVKVQVQHL
ncbi:MAG: oxidoreductase [Proteobacteria bacterium]|jgi:uncharacterized protein YbjT (DUF2867 family)|nr:oxidoreductase [Pseudomonadota bacterium]